MIAFKSIMVIRDIQLRKAAEAKHEKLKQERKGNTVPEKEEEKDPTHMNEEEARNYMIKKKEKEEEELMTEE